MEILNVADLSFTYNGASVPTLKNISFSAEEGEFIVLSGATGSGKSTLLRLLKPELSPLGTFSGDIFFNGKLISSARPDEIGFVAQNPEQQSVTDKVWHEIAFGLENMGMPQEKTALRCAETAGYFGIEDIYFKSISGLSGGQKQLVNLAAVSVTDPKLLILDEPTAQLDPIAASELIHIIKKFGLDFSVTVIISEHRSEEVIPLCDKLVIIGDIKNGAKSGLIAKGAPADVITAAYSHEDIMCGMPAAARISAKLGAKKCALTVKEGRSLVRRYKNEKKLPEKKYTESAEKALEFKDVFFRYEKNSPDILNSLTFSVSKGEIFCIMGANGSGKTTTLKICAGLLRPHSGNVFIFGKKIKDYKNQSLYNECLAMLPQDIHTVFLYNTVREELKELSEEIKLPFDLTPLYDMHPYDLSGGEQQLTALAKILALKPRLLLLDEPTKGLDTAAKLKLISVLKSLCAGGMTVVSVTHDTEFAAECADKCALFFKGGIAACAPPEKFFSDNSFYTTAASRITRGHFENAVTASRAAELCLLNGEKDFN